MRRILTEKNSNGALFKTRKQRPRFYEIVANDNSKQEVVGLRRLNQSGNHTGLFAEVRKNYRNRVSISG